MWRARAQLPDNPVFSATDKTDLGFRVFLCVALGIGVFYGLLIFTTFQKYGKEMDRKWKKRVNDLLQAQLANLQSTTTSTQSQLQGPQTTNQPPPSQFSHLPVPPTAPSPQTPFTPGEAYGQQYLSPQGWSAPVMPYQAQAQAQAMSSRQSRTPSPRPFEQR